MPMFRRLRSRFRPVTCRPGTVSCGRKPIACIPRLSIVASQNSCAIRNCCCKRSSPNPRCKIQNCCCQQIESSGSTTSFGSSCDSCQNKGSESKPPCEHLSRSSSPGRGNDDPPCKRSSCRKKSSSLVCQRVRCVCVTRRTACLVCKRVECKCKKSC